MVTLASCMQLSQQLNNKLAHARPTMQCIPLVHLTGYADIGKTILFTYITLTTGKDVADSLVSFPDDNEKSGRVRLLAVVIYTKLRCRKTIGYINKVFQLFPKQSIISIDDIMKCRFKRRISVYESSFPDSTFLCVVGKRIFSKVTLFG